MEGGETVTIVTFSALKKQWVVAFVVLLLFGSTLPLAAAAANAKPSCPSAGKTIFVVYVNSNLQTASVGTTVVTTVTVSYVQGVGESPTLSPQTISFRWAGSAGEKIVENAPVVHGAVNLYTYTQTVGDDFPTGTVTIFVVACSCSDGQGNSGPITDISSDSSDYLDDNSILQIGAATQQPAQPATEDLLATYSIPIVIAIVAIVGLLLLVLRTRKKKT
jgi:hypothetical protein